MDRPQRRDPNILPHPSSSMQSPSTPSLSRPRPSPSVRASPSGPSSAGPGPSSAATATASSPNGGGAANGATSASTSTDLWTDILRSADRQKALARKNVVLLAERHRGRSHLLDKLAGKRRAKPASSLAIGYDVLESDDRDEDASPPLSVFYPPSSHPALLRLVDVSLPPNPLPDTAIVIVLDWTKPSSMVRELLTWLAWVDQWAARGKDVERDELREKLQSYLQHYAEPTATTGHGATPSIAAGYNSLGTLLPLGPGSLTLNPAGVPITVVCTRADLMDTVGDEMGMKGGGWEERTDWIQQVLRTVCLAYGAALFYTAPTQPQTYTLLRKYLFHRLYTVPPPLVSVGAAADAPLPSRFPFPHRANVLDRDAVMVPSGWDSWGKINVLREGFDPSRVGKAWEASVARIAGGGETDDESIEDLWVAMIPDNERPKPTNQAAVTTTSEPEQAFLTRQLEVLLKDPKRNATDAFRHAAASASAAGAAGTAPPANPTDPSERYAGVVGPMGRGGLSLPGVERAMAVMESGDDGDRFARLGRRNSPQPASPAPGDRQPGVPNEALHNFFQGLLAKKTSSQPNATPTKAAK